MTFDPSWPIGMPPVRIGDYPYDRTARPPEFYPFVPPPVFTPFSPTPTLVSIAVKCVACDGYGTRSNRAKPGKFTKCRACKGAAVTQQLEVVKP